MSDGLTVIDPVTTEVSDQGSGGALSGWSDGVGMVASIGCAIHCAAMPFVIAYLPALGLSFLADEDFHKWMAVACFVIALTAFVPGLRKHGRMTPVIIGSVGLVIISIAAFGFAGECCAGCESSATQGGLVSIDSPGDANSLSAKEGCADACCDLCTNSTSASAPKDEAFIQSAASMLPTDASFWGQLLGRVAPWLTPIGGIILVTAHLLNRRYGCLCGCCRTDAKPSKFEAG